MKPTPESSTQEVLAGLVERVTFHNAENGFCVFRANARGHRDLVIAIAVRNVSGRRRWSKLDEWLRLLWVSTAPGSPHIEPSTRLAIRLLLLTGARAGGVCGAFWDEVNVETAEWIVPASRTKNARTHTIPLSDLAMVVVSEAAALRQREWLLSAASAEGHVTPSGVLRAVQLILGDDVTTHDLRRTAATGLQWLGVRLEVTEALLNHVSGSRAGVVGV